MGSDFADAIRQLQEDRGISEDLIIKTVEDFLVAAYKRKFGTSENCVVKFNDGLNGVAIYAQKEIVDDDDFYDPVSEIVLSEALEYNEDCEVGDELLIEVDPAEFDRISVQSAKQRARQDLREIQKDTLYSEFKDKVGEMVIGYYQREKNGNIFVDLGKTEGVLPKKFQSPREEYHSGDRIKALIHEVEKTPGGLRISLTRTHGDFVKAIFELEVPEVYDGLVEINRIVREPGYRTKIAVSSNREDVDPVGACVGLKGVRIQSIVRELEGEKIDILKYDNEPTIFIKNALSPAEVQDVIILDGAKRQALAIVSEDHLSLAIGKQGLNVRLANRLVDWSIDVKTSKQFAEMDIKYEASMAASSLFTDESEEITKISELPEIPERIAEILSENGIDLIETLVNIEPGDLDELNGLTEEDATLLKEIISDNLDIVDEEETVAEEEIYEESEEEDSDDSEDDTFECPECGADINIKMTACPSCGVGLSFEIEEVEE